MFHQLLFYALLLMPFCLFAEGPSNVLIYTDPVQVSASINTYETLAPGKPISGSIMITHNATATIDEKSFRVGDKPLAAQFVEMMPMSEFSPLQVTIYQFQLEGMKAGSYTLPLFTVKVGGKVYQAPAVPIQIGS